LWKSCAEGQVCYEKQCAAGKTWEVSLVIKLGIRHPTNKKIKKEPFPKTPFPLFFPWISFSFPSIFSLSLTLQAYFSRYLFPLLWISLSLRLSPFLSLYLQADRLQLIGTPERDNRTERLEMGKLNFKTWARSLKKGNTIKQIGLLPTITTKATHIDEFDRLHQRIHGVESNIRGMQSKLDLILPLPQQRHHLSGSGEKNNVLWAGQSLIH